MERTLPSFAQALAALENEWRDIVREHGDLWGQPYDLERDARHEVRLRRYKATWEHLVGALTEKTQCASNDDISEMLTLQ